MFKHLLLLLLVPGMVLAESNCLRSNTYSEILINNIDGTITDSKTRLMWKQCSEEQLGEYCEEGKAEAYNWLAVISL